MERFRVRLFGCAAAVLMVAGCSESATTSRRKADVASTPAAAALGFAQAVHSGSALRFACLPGRSVDVFGTDVSGRPVVAVTRVGARWVATVSYPSDPLNSSRYEIRGLDGGYCVDRILPSPAPDISPTTPGPYTGTDTSSEPATSTPS